VAYSTIGAVTFFIALLLVQKQQGKGTKFYPIFYILWITLLYIVILYYSYGEEWKENMFGYTSDIRSMSQGRAASTMELAQYEEVPPNVAQEIIEKRNK